MITCCRFFVARVLCALSPSPSFPNFQRPCFRNTVPNSRSSPSSPTNHPTFSFALSGFLYHTERKGEKAIFLYVFITDPTSPSSRFLTYLAPVHHHPPHNYRCRCYHSFLLQHFPLLSLLTSRNPTCSQSNLSQLFPLPRLCLWLNTQTHTRSFSFWQFFLSPFLFII